MLASRELRIALAVTLLAAVLVMVGGEDRASAHATCRPVDVGHIEAGAIANEPRCRRASRS